MLRVLFKRPYRPVAQTAYYAGAAILGAGLLIVGQSWAIGLLVFGSSGVLLMTVGAHWRRRSPN